MPTTFRVATMETLFTANTTDVDVAVKRVRDDTQALDGQTTQVDVIADAVQALAEIDDVGELLHEIDGESAAVEVTADAEKAADDLDQVAEQIGDLDGEKVKTEVDVDASGAKRGLDEAGEGLDEFKDEANGTAREAAASFDGSAESIGDVFQELAANAFAGFGPAGAAAGIAVAVGLGTAITAMQDAAEENDAFTEKAIANGQAIAEGTYAARDAFVEWGNEVKGDNWITFWSDESKSNLDAVRESARAGGEDFAAMVAPFVEGDYEAAQENLASLRERQDELNEAILTGTTYTMDGIPIMNESAQAASDQKDGVDALVEATQEQIDALTAAHEQAVLQVAATEGLTEAEAEYEVSLRTTNDALEARADLNQSRLEANLDLQDGLAALTEHEDGWTASLDGGTKAGRDNIREILSLTDDIQSLGEATLDQTGSQEKANAAMQSATSDLLDTAEAAGYNRREVEKLIGKILGIPDDAETDLEANDKATPTIDAVLDDLNDLPGYKQIDIRTVFSTTGQPPPGTGTVLLEANGGVVDFFAGGGIREDHVAQIAPAGAWRVWAEDETGGEAYIPLAPSKRARSMAILDEVATRFGATLTTRANGSVDLPSGSVTGGGVTATLAAEDRALMRAVADRPVQLMLDGRAFAEITRSTARRFAAR